MRLTSELMRASRTGSDPLDVMGSTMASMVETIRPSASSKIAASCTTRGCRGESIGAFQSIMPVVSQSKNRCIGVNLQILVSGIHRRGRLGYKLSYPSTPGTIHHHLDHI